MSRLHSAASLKRSGNKPQSRAGSHPPSDSRISGRRGGRRRSQATNERTFCTQYSEKLEQHPSQGSGSISRHLGCCGENLRVLAPSTRRHRYDQSDVMSNPSPGHSCTANISAAQPVGDYYDIEALTFLVASGNFHHNDSYVFVFAAYENEGS